MLDTMEEAVRAQVDKLEGPGGISGYQERQEAKTFLEAIRAYAEDTEGADDLIDSIDSAIRRHF